MLKDYHRSEFGEEEVGVFKFTFLILFPLNICIAVSLETAGSKVAS